MNIFFIRDPAEMASAPDNAVDAVVIAVSKGADVSRLAEARAAFPRAAIVAEVDDPALALDALRAGAHATAPPHASDADRSEIVAVAVARRVAEDARVVRESAARDEALWVMSHELRNPLNVVAMTVALLMESGDLAADKRAAHMEKVARAVARIAAHLDDASDLARIAGGTLTLSLSRVAVGAVVAQAVTDMDDRRDVPVDVDVPPELAVDVDTTRIVRALRAAIGRVVFATASDPDARVVITAREHVEQRQIELHIHTTLARAASLGRGAALQLTTSARIIEAHGGRAWSTLDLERSCDLRLKLPRSK
jgi:signal transduction histidine kinase